MIDTMSENKKPDEDQANICILIGFG